MNRRFNSTSWLVGAMFLLAIASTSSGKVIYVDDDKPADFNTIQAAIDDSNNGDTIIVADGIYTGEGNRDIDFLGKAITLRSENGPENCIIDCNGTHYEPHRGFYFHSGEDANSVLEGFTITNGYANDIIRQYGGAIYGNGTQATIQYNHIVDNMAFSRSFPGVVQGGGLYDCDGIIQYNIISGNSAVAIDMESFSTGGGLYGCDGTIKDNIISRNCADFGGGMEIYLSDPIISGCVFTENIATYDGGGVYNYSGSPTLTNCTFNMNSAFSGGGMYNNYGSPTLTNCTFTENQIQVSGIITNGGGMCNFQSSALLTNCYFICNSADTGGAMCNFQSSPTMTECTFSKNMSGSGGGMANSESNPTLSNCAFRGNSAEGTTMMIGAGGGMCNYDSNAVVVNCAFSGNSARHGGSGMDNCQSNLTITNCTFIGNYGVGIYNYHKSQSTLINCILWNDWKNDDSTITVTYSDVQGGWPGEGNIDSDPCFAEPGYWDPNGTPQDANDDFWVDGDYHLKSQAGRWEPISEMWVQDDVTSPCIDAGDWMSPIGLEPFPNGGRVNMGTYGGTAEASKSYFGRPVCEVIVAGDVNGDCIVNFLDFRIMALHWLEDNNPPSPPYPPPPPPPM